MNPKLTRAECAEWFSWDEKVKLRQLVDEAFENADKQAGVQVIVEWFERSQLARFEYHVRKARAPA